MLNMINRKLCVPCSEELKAEGRELQQHIGRKIKDKCARCKRQRFVYTYSVQTKGSVRNG